MRFSDLNAWLRWQEDLHPSAIELGLDRVAAVWERMGPPTPRFAAITIAGTNGKGSCAAMLEAVYRAAGYRTGCYTSPHLLRYNERIRIDGREVEDTDLCAAFDRVDSARGESRLTYFEFGTLAAFDLFTGADPDVAILEVGLGGRLDAVNLLDPDLALVASIGRDHMAWLGDDLASIAAEKAGIFRPSRPAVVGHRAPQDSLVRRAADLGAELHRLGKDFDWEPEGAGWRWWGPGASYAGLPALCLRGAHQYDNAAAVLMALSRLSERLPVSAPSLRHGLQGAWIPGRFQVLPGEVTWILDVAHNDQAAGALADTLASFPCPGRLHAVLGILRDKEPASFAAPLARRVARWHLGQAAVSRALPAPDLKRELSGLIEASKLTDYSCIEAALEGAAAAADPGDCVLVSGSFTTVEAALRKLTAPASGSSQDARFRMNP